ncbi:hypothetical protein ABZ468_46215 [Streptomyces sp. NPDC005708]|uniref:hypothetical protein n=1 Tax=unclassified Streptomyces TaxID=2593676 RepID=UPI0033DCD6C6
MVTADKRGNRARFDTPNTTVGVAAASGALGGLVFSLPSLDPGVGLLGKLAASGITDEFRCRSKLSSSLVRRPS